MLTSDVSASLFYQVRFTRVLSCVMLVLISSIIARIQLNLAIIDIQENYKRRLNLSRLLSTTASTFTGTRVKWLWCRRERKERRFWTRPGRTSTWCNNFVDQVVISEEWKENFRVSRDSLYNLAEELRPYIQRKATNMRSPVGVVKKVACTLYYLSDEGHLRKTANAFGLSWQVVSKIVRKVCKAITVHLGPRYIGLPSNEVEVKNLVENFYQAYNFP